jgi:hypothetical protein
MFYCKEYIETMKDPRKLLVLYNKAAEERNKKSEGTQLVLWSKEIMVKIFINQDLFANNFLFLKYLVVECYSKNVLSILGPSVGMGKIGKEKIHPKYQCRCLQQ